MAILKKMKTGYLTSIQHIRDVDTNLESEIYDWYKLLNEVKPNWGLNKVQQMEKINTHVIKNSDGTQNVNVYLLNERTETEWGFLSMTTRIYQSKEEITDKTKSSNQKHKFNTRHSHGHNIEVTVPTMKELEIRLQEIASKFTEIDMLVLKEHGLDGELLVQTYDKPNQMVRPMENLYQVRRLRKITVIV